MGLRLPDSIEGFLNIPKSEWLFWSDSMDYFIGFVDGAQSLNLLWRIEWVKFSH